MSLFYFDIHDGKNLTDDLGTECADLKAMEREALQAAGEMISEEIEFRTEIPWNMTVRDENRNVVALLTLSARICGGQLA